MIHSTTIWTIKRCNCETMDQISIWKIQTKRNGMNGLELFRLQKNMMLIMMMIHTQPRTHTERNGTDSDGTASQVHLIWNFNHKLPMTVGFSQGCFVSILISIYIIRGFLCVIDVISVRSSISTRLHTHKSTIISTKYVLFFKSMN